jgi:cell division protein FtsB
MPESEPTTPTDDGRPSGSMTVSLLFWIALFTAAGLYAAATLSAKAIVLDDRTRELARQSARTVQLAERLEHLERLAHALESDPEYVAARAHQDLKVKTPGAVVLVPEATPITAAVNPSQVVAPRAWYWPWLDRVARDSLLRNRMLLASAVLVLFGFAFLQERRSTVD